MTRALLALTLLAPALALAQPPAPVYDLILRGGIVMDGTGAPRRRADVAITRGHIARVGNLAGVRARAEIDVRGLVVAPGFINIHSHANPGILPTAENMLTQGVTTELLNADGAGPTDIGAQLDALQQAGLAVNVAASTGFNTAWSTVMGPSDRRPSAEEIARASAIVTANLEKGAYGVSAGLDYKPAYFATTEEVIRILEPARRWRTFFPNHDRLTPESGFSSRKGMEETMAIGNATGLLPVFTHMKAQGRERGSAPAVVAMMDSATRAGRAVAADIYPYLAGQTALAALIIPGWAQDGGIPKMRERFKDPALRARIIAESNEAIAARFAGPEGIVLNQTGRRISDIMKERGLATPGEAVVSVLETEFPSMIATFGAEEDLVRFLQHPDIAVACDCGAWKETRAHPRGFGTFPRILGHYVRETRALTWENAVRKMSGLPAAIMGLADRGLIAPGMAADIAVFDSATVIDHATYEKPDALSEGIRVVVVNGVVALKDGVVTGERGGRALRRTPHEPSRVQRFIAARTLTARGRIGTGDSARTLTVSLAHARGATAATGSVQLTGAGASLASLSLGTLQVTGRWASVTGRARLRGAGDLDGDRAFTLIVDAADPGATDGAPTVLVQVEGMPPVRGTLSGTARITP
jgi:N-acyl-D-aspartate/D-glutamate deacylase